MPLYLNCRFDDGERLAVEVATVKGWADFCAWARALPPGFQLLHALAGSGTCSDPSAIYDELHAAAKVERPGPSAAAVVNRLCLTLPDEGTVAVSEEPDDSEFDEEEED